MITSGAMFFAFGKDETWEAAAGQRVRSQLPSERTLNVTADSPLVSPNRKH